MAAECMMGGRCVGSFNKNKGRLTTEQWRTKCNTYSPLTGNRSHWDTSTWPESSDYLSHIDNLCGKSPSSSLTSSKFCERKWMESL